MQRQIVWQFNFVLLFDLALQTILIASNCREQFNYLEVKTGDWIVSMEGSTALVEWLWFI